MMGSIKWTKKGREKHFMDKVQNWTPDWKLPRNPKKQKKSLKGQKPLFDAPIDHLDKK